jgi:hypothetical protein
MVGHTIEFFKMISPAKRARPEGRAAVCFCIYCIVPVKHFGAIWFGLGATDRTHDEETVMNGGARQFMFFVAQRLG